MAQAGFVQEMTWGRTAAPPSGNHVIRYPEAAAQTFVKGDPVVLNVSGQVLLAVDTGNIHGIADEDASGTTDNRVKVIVINPDTDVYVASQSNAGAEQNSAQTQVGLQCSFIKSTVTGQTTKTVLDTADVGNLNCEILELKDPAGTPNGEVYFRFVRGVVQAR